jgi:hypothetical protein
MASLHSPRRFRALAAGTLLLSACATLPGGSGVASLKAPNPDPRVGLKAGLYDAGEAAWNMKVVSKTRPPKAFEGITNSDLAFSGKYAIQGNYNGWQIWDISNPSAPTIATAYVCPASQSDVSVYKNLLFISGEGLTGRIDCGTQAPQGVVSKDRLRGVRIFDITDIKNPKNVGNVQTCRGSHTHSLLVDPKDPDNVYVYISGSAGVRSADELPGCVSAPPSKDPNSALFRIEVIKVPVAHPEQAAIVNSPRIFNDLVQAPSHGLAPDDKADIDAARARGEFIVELMGQTMVMPQPFTRPVLDSVVKARGGSGYAAATAADTAVVRNILPGLLMKRFGIEAPGATSGPRPGPTQCHDITLYPAIGRAGGACEGYGLLLDISNPSDPKRIGAVADSNFSYWHSATFNNDGTTILFSDEWGGGGGPKCRASDPKEWGADAIFKIIDGKMVFQSYYKMSAPQTKFENCVAHNGSLIPIPGRDIMVQSWYQGGVSVFEFTDPAHPQELAFFDRGPVDATRMGNGGTWSVYWYNGVIVSSEISRGLDIFELTPSAAISQNEIDAAKSVQWDYLNTQGQRKITWPATFALSRAYTDQLERSKGLGKSAIADVRKALADAEAQSGAARSTALHALGGKIDGMVAGSKNSAKVKKLAASVHALAQ